VLWLPLTANVVPSLLILVTLIMEVIRSSEMSVLIRATQRNIQEDNILHKKSPWQKSNFLKYITCTPEDNQSSQNML
jgi:hypothetical protein